MGVRGHALLAAAALVAHPVRAWSAPETPPRIVINQAATGPTISRDIFGQFAEMLGNGVYGGIWVGADSAIPNVRGIRSDVVSALRAIKVPVIRWPGGCFADQYEWRDGIGPAARRTSRVNFWGNVLEPNSFGTYEYMDFLNQIGSEAYISINVGSGTPEGAAAWLEYMTTNQPSTLGRLRAANGHPAPYRVKYLGIGNEAWGCGGGMSADHYVEEYKRFATFARNLNPSQNASIAFARSKNAMRLIAVGPDSDKTDYTEAVMKMAASPPQFGWRIDGLSLHYYSGGRSGVLTSPSVNFGNEDYAASLKSTLRMDELIKTHSAIMDKYDPQKKVGLIVDEWGLWAMPLAGTNFNFMRQQGTLRDAVVAALNLNIFARHADRVRMANIAQMANVIHSLILTDGPRMTLTPTYYVYKMYVPFQDATLIPVSYDPGTYVQGKVTLPRIDALAARSLDGRVWVALTNLDPESPADVALSLSGVPAKGASGSSLTADRVDAANSSDHPDAVAPRPVKVDASDGALSFHLAPKSVTVVTLDQ